MEVAVYRALCLSKKEYMANLCAHPVAGTNTCVTDTGINLLLDVQGKPADTGHKKLQPAFSHTHRDRKQSIAIQYRERR